MRVGHALITVLLAGSTTVAVAQVTRQSRPPIKLAPVQQQSANTVGGAGRVDAQIGELQAQIDSLSKKLEAQQNMIQGLKSQVASNGAVGKSDLNALSQRMNALEGKLGAAAGKSALAALRAEFVNHKHWSYYEKEELGKNQIKPLVTSCPLDHIVENPSATNARDRYKCSGS